MKERYRRAFGVVLIAVAMVLWVFESQSVISTTPTVERDPVVVPPTTTTAPTLPGSSPLALEILDTLAVKGRAPKTGYKRAEFGDGWSFIGSCDMRNIILGRDLASAVISETCKVESGVLNDPYTGTTINFVRGIDTSDVVQIDHVVSLSDAWQKGAQLLTSLQRVELANDPLELLAVDGRANQAKGDGDAATWLPANKSFRCQYVSRQIAVKAKYNLWVTDAERSAMQHVLSDCPEQTLPTVN